ncbi:hypothetical protein BJF85_23090 [Saccharomonospora sp. CUA-673]|uniref:hypothetical protein n=1 Tax=Saccharomonospora sp. CUA-673 TaxID=1904969 RepID=UPI0009614052|nr:hypothetical protein [Saccharomonospora sp. CUA-673]OLT42422.1 hypothetical protein BJF85_23090 [Saccharomonospora sp. CUA-673]
MMQDVVGPFIGVLILWALCFLLTFVVVRSIRHEKPQQRTEKEKSTQSMASFLDQVQARQFSGKVGTPPAWGIVPSSDRDMWGTTRRHEWDDGIQFDYRGHEVQAVDCTVRVSSTSNSRAVYRSEQLFQVRTPPWPVVQLNARQLTRYRGAGDQFPEITLGNQFDQAFRITAEDERFARVLLQGPVLEFLMTDPRCAQSWMIFQAHCLWTAREGKLEPAAMLRFINPLVDVVDRLPRQAWDYRR